MNAGYSVNFYDRVGEDTQHNTYNYQEGAQLLHLADLSSRITPKVSYLSNNQRRTGQLTRQGTNLSCKLYYEYKQNCVYKKTAQLPSE